MRVKPTLANTPGGAQPSASTPPGAPVAATPNTGAPTPHVSAPAGVALAAATAATAAAPAATAAAPATAAASTTPPATPPTNPKANHFGARVLDKALLAVLLIFAAIFIVWPIACFIWQGFTPSEEGTGFFQTLLNNSELLFNSAFVGVLASLLSCVLALAVSLVITFGPRRWASIVTGLVTISMISPPFVASLAFIELFGRRGLITHGLLGLSISPYGWVGIVLMQSLFFAAINVFLLTSVLGRVDKNAVRAALDLGAPMRRVFIDVIVPLLRPALSVCLLLTFVRSISDYATPVVIGGKFETVATQIYVRVVGFSDLSEAAVLNVLLFLVAILAFVLYRKLDRAGTAGSGTLGISVRPNKDEAGFRLTGIFGLVTHIICGLFAAFLFVLYLTIIHAAFTKGVGWNATFTLEQLQHLVEFDLGSLGRSVWFSLLTAITSTALGLLAAYFVHRRNIKGGALMDFVTTVPYTLPGLCLGLGYILAFNNPPLELTGSALILITVLASKELAISTRAFTAALAQIPPELDMAAKDLGASEPSVLGGVLLPNLKQAIGVSLVNGFSSAMVSYSAVLFLITPSNKTAVFELFDALSGGKYGEAAMVSLALIVITTLVNVVFYQVLLKRRK